MSNLSALPGGNQIQFANFDDETRRCEQNTNKIGLRLAGDINSAAVTRHTFSPRRPIPKPSLTLQPTKLAVPK
ncbi:hypothetical protein CHU98_g1516 [Xylaria longipes]|nr:hypothetical protein CHU98_g1516 [Xylaria longipes]